jgi:hypothetical protein
MNKHLLLQVYDNVFTIHEYCNLIKCPLVPGDEDFHTFAQQTVVAFSGHEIGIESLDSNAAPTSPITSVAVFLDVISDTLPPEFIPKELVRKYFSQNERNFSLLLESITCSRAGNDRPNCSSAKRILTHLIRNGSIFTCHGSNFIQRTGNGAFLCWQNPLLTSSKKCHFPGKPADKVIAHRDFVLHPDPSRSPRPHNDPEIGRRHVHGARRKKRKTKDLSSKVIYQKNFMYDSSSKSENMFRWMFSSITASSLIQTEFPIQHQKYLLHEAEDSLLVLLQQMMRNHSDLFKEKFTLHKFCHVTIDRKKDVSELVSRYCEHSDVCNLIRIVLFGVFPFQLFGTKGHRRRFFRSLTLLVTSSYTVRYQYKNMTCGIRLQDVIWLAKLESRRDKLMAFGIFVKWTVDYFMSLLRGFFYATETQFGRFRIFFYPKHVWHKICKFSRTNGLQLTTASVTYERTRLIPKKKAVRMICPDRTPQKEADIREQGALVAVLQMIRSDARPLIFDNFSEFCMKVRAWQTSHLFMIKADIQDCYPSIRHEVMAHIIKKKVYTFFGSKKESRLIHCQEIRSLCSNSGSLKVQTHFMPLRHHLHQSEHQSNGEEFNFTGLRNRVLVPSVIITIEEPVQKITSQFRGNVIKQGEEFYLLSEGIRQGGRLSPDLCYLYMESFLSALFHDADQIHIALKADDILIAAPDADVAQRAFQRILEGSEKFNFRANREKIFTNFPAEPGVQMQSLIPFCGSLYDCDRRSVIADFSRFQEIHMRFSFNCNPFQNGYFMARYMASHFSHMRSHLMDPRLNDADIVVKNIYERSLFQSMKFACFLLSSEWHNKSQDVPLLQYFSHLLARRAYRLYDGWSVRLQWSGCVLLSEREVHFTCYSAIV